MLWKKIGRMCSYKEAFINGCKIQTPAGTIEITNDVIATVVGGAATRYLRNCRNGKQKSN